jgi:hypothetical protein
VDDYLSQAGYDIRVVNNGLKALELTKENCCPHPGLKDAWN